MREKADYRDLLERLDKTFPDGELLTRNQLAQFLGVSRQTVRVKYGKAFPPRSLLTKTAVARVLSSSG